MGPGNECLGNIHFLVSNISYWKKLFGKTAGHLYPYDQMACTCAKSNISNFFPPNKGTRFKGHEY